MRKNVSNGQRNIVIEQEKIGIKYFGLRSALFRRIATIVKCGFFDTKTNVKNMIQTMCEAKREMGVYFK